MNTEVLIEDNRVTTYMASPYSNYASRKAGASKENAQREAFTMATQACAYLMVVENRIVFSPITHSHCVDKFTPDDLKTHSFWLTQDYFWVKMCEELCILQIPGWDKSFGVGWEHGLATVLGKRIWYLEWEIVEAWIRRADEPQETEMQNV